MGHMSTTRVRMSPDSRREQLIALGVQLLATRSLEDLSIETLAEEAGISRGLLYHYFGNKQAFHTAVVQRASDDLFRVTAPSGEGSALEQLAGSLARYVDYVAENYQGYVSLVRGAAGGHEGLRQIYDESRAALTGRLFDGPLAEEAAELGLTDTPAVRLLVRGWAAFTEEVVLDWVRDNRGITRDELLLMLAASLPGILAPMRPQDDTDDRTPSYLRTTTGPGCTIEDMSDLPPDSGPAPEPTSAGCRPEAGMARPGVVASCCGRSGADLGDPRRARWRGPGQRLGRRRRRTLRSGAQRHPSGRTLPPSRHDERPPA